MTVDPAQIGETDQDPEQNQAANDQCPDPDAGFEKFVDGSCTVVDHDGRPSDELKNIQKGEEDSAETAEAHTGGFHGASAGAPADDAREIHHQAADQMAGQDRSQSLPKAKRREIGAGQDFSDRDAGTEPDEAGLENSHVKAAGSAAAVFLITHSDTSLSDWGRAHSM